MTRDMRQSMIGTADICQTRLSFSIDPERDRRGSVVPAIGTGYHGSMDALYGSRLNGGPWTQESILEAGFAAFDREVQLAEKFNWKVNDRLWTYGEACELIESMVLAYLVQGCEWPSEYEVKGVEQKFSLPWIDGWNRSGTIDLLLYRPLADWYLIIDHKTSSKRWSAKKSTAAASPQAQWYLDAFMEILGTDRITFVFDVMTYAGRFDRISAPRTPSQLRLTRLKAEQVAGLVDRGGPFMPNPSSNLCSETYCSWWADCPYGSTMNAS